ncbi:hypothetical protein BESB_075290 [Besnoitia besnoiti]|uniref:Uncharacterized protein n=1 Tax=Besnoitia besnoiti TaxID=94643 RepID=A0A2A9MFI6_BESBE|nr:uncharacterized protein BESB_075290 [Besnoitia besnoiti]PFH34377.1 hypothetical protein BESB_075290 [Besnoitia besnoiti]
MANAHPRLGARGVKGETMCKTERFERDDDRRTEEAKRVAPSDSEDDWEDEEILDVPPRAHAADLRKRKEDVRRPAGRVPAKQEERRGFPQDDVEMAEEAGLSRHASSEPSSPEASPPQACADFAWLSGFQRSRDNAFRCKAATFAWDDAPDSDPDAAAAIPAFDLPPQLKVLRLSIDGAVPGEATTLLQAYLDALHRVDEAPSARTSASPGEVSFPLPAAKKLSLETQECTVSYQPPLGDEVHIGSSPQHTQILSSHRFLGTLHFSPAPKSAAQDGAERHTPLESSACDAARAQGAAPSVNAEFGTERGIPQWQKEASFVTWHRVKPYGTAESPCTGSPGSQAGSPAPRSKPHASSAKSEPEEMEDEEEVSRHEEKRKKKEERKAKKHS